MRQRRCRTDTWRGTRYSRGRIQSELSATTINTAFHEGKYQRISTEVTILNPISVSAMPQSVARTSSLAGSRPLVRRAGGGLPRSAPDVRWVCLEETNDPTFLVNVDVLAARRRAQARHGPHFADDRVNEAGADRSAHLAHQELEAGWPTLQRRVAAE